MFTSIPASTLEKYATFGDLLRFLRRRAGLTQLELSIAVGYSDAQISRLEQNLRLPDLPTIEARFVPALGVENEPEIVTRLLDLGANLRREDAPVLGLCPYKGLNYFDEADADLFVGREGLTEKLVQRILRSTANKTAGKEKFLAVIGASGSGKSSLVRAGLVPALRWNPVSANWPIHTLTPTVHPLESLAAALTQHTGSLSAAARLMDDLASDPRSLKLHLRQSAKSTGATHLLLVVDQFEELFALCRSEEERTSFIENLLTASMDVDGPAVLIITLRADFYAHCAGYPQLREALAHQQEYIGAMSADELRRAIEEPARRGHWEFEPGLVDLLLHDVGSEPGALPLLSHALLETWQRRRGRTMTLSGYTSSGGVRGAIAETAEAVFADQFDEKQQATARRIFLRLTELGDEPATGDTRRRAPFHELILKSDEAGATQAVIKTLADARLITTSEDSAEVAHEALIREWPTLRGWLEDNREGLRLHRHLTGAAQEWQAADCEPETLYRGARLAQVREWAAAHGDEMNEQERQFLAASIEYSEREAANREAQRQHELEIAQKLAQAESQRAEDQAQSARQLRRRAIIMASALVASLVMASVALFFGSQARQAAVTAQNQQRISFSRELSAASVSNLEGNPERSILLALEAVSVARSSQNGWIPEAEDALRRALLGSRAQLTLRGHTGRVWGAAFSPDCAISPDVPVRPCGTRVATIGEDGAAIVWDSVTGKMIHNLTTGAKHEKTSLAFSPDGARLVTTGRAGTALVWDAVTGQPIFTLEGHTDWVPDISYSPDGRLLATASEDRTAVIWDAETGQRKETLQGHTGEVWAVAFSSDNKRVATAGIDGTVIIWDAETAEKRLTFPGHRRPINDLAFSPDGKRLASASDDRSAVVWDAATGQELLTLRDHTDFVSRVAYSPDGSRLATTSFDGKVNVWDAISGQKLFVLFGHTGPVIGVSFSPDCIPEGLYQMVRPCGSRLATVSWDGTARLWNASFSRELLTISTPGVSAGALSPDGTRVAVGYLDGTLKAWDISTSLQNALSPGSQEPAAGVELFTLTGHAGNVNNMAFSPDGKRLASVSEDQTLKLWDAASGSELKTFSGHIGGVLSVAFSPDGTRLATTSKDPAVMIWDAATGQALHTFPMFEWGFAIAFSPDGTRLAAGFNNGFVRLWDVSSGGEQKVFQTLGTDIRSISFSPDGTKFATGGQDGTAILWDAGTGQELVNLRRHSHSVNGITFSPDGSRLAIAGQDGTVRIWEPTTGREILTLLGHVDAIAGLAYTPDGKYLISGSFNGTIRFHLAHLEDLEALARSRITRGLTAEECQQYLHLSEAQCQEVVGAGAPVSTPAAQARGTAQGAPAVKSKVCELTDIAGVNDQFYNQLAYQGVQASAAKFDWEGVVLESLQRVDHQKDMTSLLQSNCELIVTPTGFYLAEVVEGAAKANPAQKFMTFEVPDPLPENVWVQFYAVDQAGFLAGYVAASVTKTGKVGTFGGMALPSATGFMDGFTLGVDYYNGKNRTQVEVLGWNVEEHQGLFTGNWDIPEDGRRMGETLMDQGADVILPVAGGSGLGAAAAVKERGGAYLVGVDSDWYVTYPEYADVLLTSIEKRLDVSVVSAVQSIVDGTFTGGPHFGTLENGGVSLAPFHNLDALVSPQVKQDLEQIKKNIIAGKIKTLPEQ